jgi:hypothetical protein
MSGDQEHIPSVQPEPIKSWRAVCSCGWKNTHALTSKQRAQEDALSHWKAEQRRASSS